MGNLQTGIPGPPTAAPPPPTALLRKVQSESNLLKIKNKRERAGAGAPYSRVFTTQLSLVPETSAVLTGDDEMMMIVMMIMMIIKPEHEYSST